LTSSVNGSYTHSGAREILLLLVAGKVSTTAERGVGDSRGRAGEGMGESRARAGEGMGESSIGVVLVTEVGTRVPTNIIRTEVNLIGGGQVAIIPSTDQGGVFRA
jgi:hypothetical protein